MSEPPIELLVKATDEHAEAVAHLLPQLSSAKPPNRAGLQAIADGGATSVLFARNKSGTIVGTLSIVVFLIPSGVRAHIEDVVVDEIARGEGVASALVHHAINLAIERGARSIELTSRPSREAANRLYRALGFVERETNVYRWSADSAPS